MCEWLKQAVLKTYVPELATACNQLNSKRIGGPMRSKTGEL